MKKSQKYTYQVRIPCGLKCHFDKDELYSFCLFAMKKILRNEHNIRGKMQASYSILGLKRTSKDNFVEHPIGQNANMFDVSTCRIVCLSTNNFSSSDLNLNSKEDQKLKYSLISS